MIKAFGITFIAGAAGAFVVWFAGWAAGELAPSWAIAIGYLTMSSAVSFK